ncbi:hypothetical protein [Paenibacillus larvae]|uniref:hypothetical protein n=1 Tax=Paenibacillus larvae TaxID=1464 RepID=UPI002890E1A2|nr:hypothetical protein [Paenibacillus larvae]MDT2191680.1 hypothetical protein [Paenibacillus larvae]MDT2238117.1 hypothetical protein [Paenibacillus larvae]MDT2242466.1 hypothetical protein [Paenibacillus larvae]MDT2248251.1 hypothetical protein [Paenibacillus larvae]
MNGEQEIQKAYQALLDNDFEQAIDCFEQAVRRDPLNADFHYKLSISCARSGKLKKLLLTQEMPCGLPRMMRFIYFIPGT